jgi:hypothetical protein
MYGYQCDGDKDKGPADWRFCASLLADTDKDLKTNLDKYSAGARLLGRALPLVTTAADRLCCV